MTLQPVSKHKTHLLTFAVLLTAPALIHADELILSNKSITPRVLISPDATTSEKYAAQELTEYLGKMIGRTVETVVSAASLTPTPKSPVIILGHHPQNLDLKPSKLGIEESIISIEKNRVRIIGGKLPPIPYEDKGEKKIHPRDRGTLYGTYNFLDDLGVRWYRPAPWGEHVPSRKKIVLPLGKTLDKPGYKYRMGMNIYRWWPDMTPEQRRMIAYWQVRNRINIGGSSGWDGGKYIVQMTHSHFNYVPPWKYFKTNPEYFALVNGKRINNGQLCLGNPEVEKILGDAVIATAKAQPQVDYLPIDPNDGMKWCECELCRVMDDPNLMARNGADQRLNNVSMSNRVNIFNNRIAKRLAKEVPGKGVTWLAYLAFTEAPTKISKFEPNTIVAPTSMAAAYSDYSKMLDDPNSKGNVNLREVFEGYSKTGTTMGAHEYWLGGYWYGPIPVLNVMKDRYSNYRKYNVQLMYSETHLSWGPQTVVGYFYARLAWNPDLNLDKELAEFCRNYYGPAAEPMLKYHRLLEKASLKGKPWYLLGMRLGDLFTDDQLMAQMTRYMNEARRKVQGKMPYERRLHGDWAGYEVARRFNEAMRYRKNNQPEKALEVWDSTGQFLKDQNAAHNDEIFDVGKVFNSWPTQSKFYGMTALRGQLDLVKKQPGSQYLFNLNEDWKFLPDPGRKGEKAGYIAADFNDKSWHTISATSDWNSQGHSYNSLAWYRKAFQLEKKEAGKKYLFSFGAVDGDTVIYLNGKRVGEHWLGADYSGYNKPFTIDVTDVLVEGKNTAVVQVTKDFALAGITQGVSVLSVTEGATQ